MEDHEVEFGYVSTLPAMPLCSLAFVRGTSFLFLLFLFFSCKIGSFLAAECPTLTQPHSSLAPYGLHLRATHSLARCSWADPFCCCQNGQAPRTSMCRRAVTWWYKSRTRQGIGSSINNNTSWWRRRGSWKERPYPRI